MAKLQLVNRDPTKISDVAIREFIALVVAGGEVARHGLEGRIRSAARLAFLRIGSELSGVAALKRPEMSYRAKVAAKSGVSLPTTTIPYELGYVFVVPSARRRGLSGRLVRKVLTAAQGTGVFATTRTNNEAMQATLLRCGFQPYGRSYKSALRSQSLRVFVRPGKKSRTITDRASS